jgi:hypothetical protein
MKMTANRTTTSANPQMATGLLRCPLCGATMNAKYSSRNRKTGSRVTKYACVKKPDCASTRLPTLETNDRLWRAFIELLVDPERIGSLITHAPENTLEALKADLRQRIGNHGRRDIDAELIQTLRVLSRSHRRFTEGQKTQAFRSIVKEARLTDAGVELDLYAKPVQNIWKYKQKKQPPARQFQPVRTIRIKTTRQTGIRAAR